ncbi:hypothetical protein GJU41_22540 [Bacillus idriensis]|uniref:Uncharacterized protein n=1 Tax=Metabacillus idriensis TaxID=324768 RepID=A0A6I2MEG2_9BACI|nr:hypothetical protein [Metabacillus idriensis]MRX56725.1 hypothetical protein [Metabacillus idriensis]
MENMTLIDEKIYYVESKKAIQVVLEREELLNKQMKAMDKLLLVKEQKSKTGSLEEYDGLEKLEKELERKVRFHQLTEPAVPEEYKEKIKRNAVIEQLAADTKSNELKALLKQHIEYLENELVPLIRNINQLEKMKKVPDQINLILDSEIGEGVPFPVYYRLKVFNPTQHETKSRDALLALQETISALKKVEPPVETKGLLSFLKKGKK